MNLSAPFVRRPIAHRAADDRHRAGRHRRLLRAAGVAAAAGRLPDHLGAARSLPGASPETMATSVATPLERRLGTIAGVNEMTSIEPGRLDPHQPAVRPQPQDIDGAAREVQAAINAARADLPATLRSNPTYRKAQPVRRAGDHPGADLARRCTPGQIYDAVSNIVQPAARAGRGRRRRRDRRRLAAGGARRAAAVRAQPLRHQRARTCAPRSRPATPTGPKGAIEGDEPAAADLHARRRRAAPPTTATDGRRLAQRRGGAPRRRRRGDRRRREHAHAGPLQRRAGGDRAGHAPARRQHHRDRRRRARAAARAARAAAGRTSSSQVASDRTNSIRASLHEIEITLLISIVLVVLVVSAVPAQRARDHHPGGGDRGLAARHLRRDVPARLLASTT